MEANLRWILVTAVAPVAWGTNYYVTREYLPAGHPLWGAAVRALPAGLLLQALSRRRPRGSWWWKAAVLGVLNTGGFFALVYLAAQLLPTSTASTVMATSPLVMMLMAWGLVAERPRPAHLTGAAVGIGGVALTLLGHGGPVGARGVLASGCALLMSSCGYVLAKRWSGQSDVLAATAWQLIAGGLLLLPFAAVVEGAPPAVGGPAVLGFGYVTLVATALAFVAWFSGLRRLPAATVGLIGLLNPVTGVLLGVAAAGDRLTGRQTAGIVLTVGGVLCAALDPGALGLAVGARARRRPGAGRRPAPAPAAPPAAPAAPRERPADGG
ncbi:DMT family transporter [Actinacidiphila sp. ITFR-21]|uniref:DMT family transporter n=1 Tax=Actinacidiphila sp. ITFR-21 TaxID=3075199 RepID=UPI0028890CEC|nr:EamA family transporter [Streptomyces sp. ITFR-21]WNI19437.1 EamA family transporter [Streptomyces sp. ITFR-21]